VIQVMLSELPPVLNLAMRTVIDDAEGLACAGDAPWPGVRAELAAHPADALVLGTLTPLATRGIVELLDEHPRLKIVCVSPDGRHAVLQERRFEQVELTEDSLAMIFDAIRTACAAEVI
jgi:hypothetical protein